MKHIFALRPLVCVATLALFVTACDGCSEKKPDPKPDMARVEVVPDVAPDLPQEDPLKEAREAAEKEAQLLAVTIGDTTRLVASQIEAANAETTTKSTSTPKARIKGNDSKETGTLDPKEASKVLRRFEGAMTKCYERALKKRPGLEGKVKLLVVVGANGSVKRAKASGLSLKDSSVNNCMEALTPRMKFSKPKGGDARISKTYSFSPAL